MCMCVCVFAYIRLECLPHHTLFTYDCPFRTNRHKTAFQVRLNCLFLRIKTKLRALGADGLRGAMT